MIVVDASAITESLLQTELGLRVEQRVYRDDEDLHAPHLHDVEVLSALRRLARSGEVKADRAEDVYLALAESLDATVVTCDRAFASASRRTARIELIR